MEQAFPKKDTADQARPRAELAEKLNDNAPGFQLGNPELPIADFRQEIVSAVDNSQVVVITAETGAGKSTQVPQFLAEAGYETVVTQPRVPAALRAKFGR